MSYDVREYYTLEVTKQQLIEQDFDIQFFGCTNDSDWELSSKETIDSSQDFEVDDESQELFDQWKNEFEEQV